VYNRNVKKELIFISIMAECYKCGADESERRLFDAIAEKKVVKICEDCLREEDLPVIRRPTTFQLKEAEHPSGVYERLARMQGLNAQEHRSKFNFPERVKEAPRHSDMSMRELVDKKFKKKTEIIRTPRPDLVDNFHWVLLRARRMKKLTQSQLAKEIGESEAAIQMAEKGVLPEDDFRLINKLETFLRVKLIKGEVKRKLPENVDFSKFDSKNLTIEDLRLMKASKNTEDIIGELEEDKELNEAGKEKLKGKGFFSKLFSRKEKKEEVPEADDGLDNVDISDIIKEEK